MKETGPQDEYNRNLESWSKRATTWDGVEMHLVSVNSACTQRPPGARVGDKEVRGSW